MMIEINEQNRFTMYFVGPHPLLLSWLGWFQSRGIRAVLVRNEFGYAVYRNDLLDVESTAGSM